MRMLILDNQVRSEIKKLIEFAHQNIVPEKQMIAIAEGKVPPVGHFPTFSLNIPVGVKVVYSVEEHPQKTGKSKTFKHISVSVDRKLPSVELVNSLLTEFSFSNIEIPPKNIVGKAFKVWLDESTRSINVVEEL